MASSSKITILTEASLNKGFGHLVRTSSLYFALLKEKQNVEFILNADDIAKQFAKSLKINFINQDWLKTEITTDIAIVDSYYYENLDNIKANKIIVIDDLKRLDFKNITILNPNFFGNNIFYDKTNQVFAGLKYSLVRDDFLNHTKQINQEVQNILISFGGTDVLNLSGKVADFVAQHTKAQIHLVAKNIKSENQQITTYQDLNGQQMADLMKLCDFAIIAAGQTLNEVIKMQIPTIAISVIENQNFGLNEFIKADLGLSVAKNDFNNILKMFDFNLRKNFNQKMQQISFTSESASKRIMKVINE